MRQGGARTPRAPSARTARAVTSHHPTLNDLPGMLWSCDEAGLITWTNQAASPLFGAADNGASIRWIDGILPDDRDQCATVFGRARALQEGFRLIYRRFGQDGNTRWLVDQAAPRFSRSRLSGYTGLAMPIDDLKESEQALRRANESLRRSNRDLDDVARAASHDLKEPLSIISVYSELLKRRSGNSMEEDAGRFVRLTLDAVQRMHGLLNDLALFLKVARFSEDPPLPVDADAVIQAVLLHHKPAIERCGATIEREPLPVVMAQEQHLLQLFQALIDNALKFHGDGPPRVRLGWLRQGREAEFQVSDNGIGIDPRYRDQVFGVFWRLHHEDYPGSGIGLALCSRIVEKYGGRIWVESQPGHGSTFHFTLPLAAGLHTPEARTGERTLPRLLPGTECGTPLGAGRDQRSAPKSRERSG